MQVQQMFEVRSVEFQRFQVVFVLLEFQVATIVVTWVWSERNPRVFSSLFAVAVEPSSISHSSSFPCRLFLSLPIFRQMRNRPNNRLAPDPNFVDEGGLSY